jgi:hypothetical protein
MNFLPSRMIQILNKLLLILFLAISIHFSSNASHIIGGDIQVSYQGNNTYFVKANRYVNEISVIQNRLGVDPYANLSCYDVLTNTFQFNLALPINSNNSINSNSNYCVDPNVVQTNLQQYSGNMYFGGNLNPNVEYYLVWELCCRNVLITNLSAPDSQNSLLYVMFPGPKISNSTPVFKLLDNEYFCTNNLNLFDFSAIDPDGDSLIYSLSSPLQSSVNSPLNYVNQAGTPVTAEGAYGGNSPFYEVTWISGLNGAYPIPCNPGQGLSISPKGMLSFNPNQTGVFTFGVLVTEYRKGKYIGQVLKDYQFNVLNCPVNNKPIIGFKDKTIKNTDTISVPINGSQCYPLYITDIDASQFGISETVFTTLNTGSYPHSGFSIPAQVNLSAFQDSVFSNLCFNPCSVLNLSKNGYYPISIAIQDNRCPARYDTITFTLKVVVPQSPKPTVTIIPLSDPKYVKVDSLLMFRVLGQDSSATNLLSLTMYQGSSGMSFPNVSDSSLHISSTFKWIPDCKAMKQNGGHYKVYFVVKDNSCIVGHADTIYQNIIVEDNSSTLDSLKRYNLVTPNKDGYNDYWALTGIPPDNCEIFFKYVEVYNRWGSRVYLSHDKYFRWYPEVEDGMYYYGIDYNEKKYSGWIEVVNSDK